jgi:hypothetical protein
MTDTEIAYRAAIDVPARHHQERPHAVWHRVVRRGCTAAYPAAERLQSLLPRETQ